MPDIADDLAAVADVLRSADSIGVVGHVGPDGDALGSMIGLARSARLAGKQAVASFDEPFVVPDEMSFLDVSVLVPPRDFPRDLDVAVVVDTSVRGRVGSLAGAMELAGQLAVIDHHICHRRDGWCDNRARSRAASDPGVAHRQGGGNSVVHRPCHGHGAFPVFIDFITHA